MLEICCRYYISFALFTGLLSNAADTDYDTPQVTTKDCMLSDPLSKSYPGQALGRGSAVPPSLSSSWPRRSPLSGLSERTKRLLGRVSPEKLLASAGVSLSEASLD